LSSSKLSSPLPDFLFPHNIYLTNISYSDLSSPSYMGLREFRDGPVLCSPGSQNKVQRTRWYCNSHLWSEWVDPRQLPSPHYSHFYFAFLKFPVATPSCTHIPVNVLIQTSSLFSWLLHLLLIPICSSLPPSLLTSLPVCPGSCHNHLKH
jgi:hypothetical protein